MAAYKYGMKTVIIPAANVPDLEEVEDVVKEHIKFVPAERMETVLETALVHPPRPVIEPAAPAMVPVGERGESASIRQ